MRSAKWMIPVAALALTAIAGCGTYTSDGNPTNEAQSQTQPSVSTPQAAQFNLKPTSERWPKAPAMQINVGKQYDAVVHTTYGDFTIQLFAKDSPKTVNNFVFLAQHQFYNNDGFFRIMKTFMIQTGDPNNNGTGGPGYQFADELPPKQGYQPGIVAMANAGPNTNGSQFFICTGADSAQLDQNPAYTQFGKVISGMNVVQKIASIPVVANSSSGEDSAPTKAAYIKSVDIQVH